MADEILKIGGNSFKEKIGKWIDNIGKKIRDWGSDISERAKPTIISNPLCKVVNPFTIIISFTVNSSEKYQLVLEGDYKQYYREYPEGIVDISTEEVFYVIRTNQGKWFKKE
jgi:hypothetical protein